MAEIGDTGGFSVAGLYKRGNVWWGRAQRQNKEQRVSLETANRAIAEKRLREWLGELDAIKWGDKPRRTFNETAERFVREHMTTVKPTTARRYGDSLKHLALNFGDKTMDQITSSALSDFETVRRSEGVTPSTIRRDLSCLSGIFTSAIDWEWVDDNPVTSYLRRRSKRGLKEAPPRTRYLSVEEEAALLAAATGEPRLAMELAIDTGLRREELFSLQWTQVDQVRARISTTKATKNGKARHVPLPRRSAQNLAQLARHMDCPFVLRNPDTGTRYLAMNKGLKAAMRRAGIADLCWHDLRRTAACRWLQRDGKSMEEVSTLLGHGDVKITSQRYAFLKSEVVAESLSGRTKVGTGTAV
jgi:integrase